MDKLNILLKICMGSCNRSFNEIHNVQSQEISNNVEKIRDLLNMLFPIECNNLSDANLKSNSWTMEANSLQYFLDLLNVWMYSVNNLTPTSHLVKFYYLIFSKCERL